MFNRAKNDSNVSGGRNETTDTNGGNGQDDRNANCAKDANDKNGRSDACEKPSNNANIVSANNGGQGIVTAYYDLQCIVAYCSARDCYER